MRKEVGRHLLHNTMYAESLGLARVVDAHPRGGLYIPFLFFSLFSSLVFIFFFLKLHVSALCCTFRRQPSVDFVLFIISTFSKWLL